MPLRHGDDDPRSRAKEGAFSVHLLDEMPKHRLGDFKVRNHAIFQWADRDDVSRGASEHSLRLVADGQHTIGARLHCDDRRLAQDDAVIFDVNEGIRGAEVYPDVV